MEFDTILEGIKSILETDNRTKDKIKLYRRHDIVERGIYAVPFCVLGYKLRLSIAESYLQNAHIYEGPIVILLLGRSYDTSAQHDAMFCELDNLQNAVYAVLNATENRKLNNTVLQSLITEIEDIRIDEYFGFSVSLEIKTKIN